LSSTSSSPAPALLPYPTLFRSEEAMTELFDIAEREFGGVDVVVHTAGIMPLAPIAQMDLDTFDRVQRTNVRGTFVVDRLAAQRLDRKSTRLNSSHVKISYAVFC